ncbi:MAG: SCP2 sterol-binding domain-containing protein [Firmicutes bacterium]|nr:SCP2 sterol-binding domain-containing protein [Bacillota bacterium]MBQ9604341.1 SCP2 sterol-binding domain-containing protein [Bacillota bacterium]
MSYEEMFAKASKMLSKAKVSDINEHIAIQFDVTGEGCGVFYAEISEGSINVQPYDYRDNDISVSVDSAALITALETKAGDTLPFVGDEAKIALIKPAFAKIPKKPVRAAAKKVEDKVKAAAKKAEDKVKAAVEKKSTAKKTTAKKTAKKAEA